MANGLIKLTGCECLHQEDKELLDIMIYDAILRRRELYESERKQAAKSTDLSLLKSYESFIDHVQNFKTCKK